MELSTLFSIRADLSQRQALILLVITALLWSLGGVLIKVVQLHPLAIAGLRSLIAAAFLLLVLRRPNFTWSTWQILGGLMYAAVMVFFVFATKLTTAANAILLQYTAPVYVALFSTWFLKEHIRPRDWISIAAVLTGMLLFFLDDLSPGGLLGNLCAIASGICLAWMVLFLRRQKEGSPLESILIGNILTGLVGLPFIFSASPTGGDWLGLVLLGVFQIAIPYILFARSIRFVSALESILIPVLEPILNPVWVMLLISETPGPWALLGGCIVILAVSVRGIAAARSS